MYVCVICTSSLIVAFIVTKSQKSSSLLFRLSLLNRHTERVAMSSVRQRPAVIIQQTSTADNPVTSTTTDGETSLPRSPQGRALPQRAITQTLAGTANLVKLLPTGTLAAFQLLIPIFTNNGSCDSVTRPLTFCLLLLLAVSCFIASFTDTVKASDGTVYHGVTTSKGLWLFDYSDDPAAPKLPDLTKYKVRFLDFAHAVLSVFVFFAVALGDKNVEHCFYPQPNRETQEVFNIVPVGVGLICSLLFVAFPSRRHGIGYPVTSGN